MTEQLTVEISAASYDEALKFCNDRLDEQNKPNITELPAGIPVDPNSCPCSTACGAFVEKTFWYMKNTADRIEHYDTPIHFIQNFDFEAKRLLLNGGRSLKTPVLPIRRAT